MNVKFQYSTHSSHVDEYITSLGDTLPQDD